MKSGIRHTAPFPIHYPRQEVLNWCEKNYGKGSLLKGRWFAADFTVLFSNEVDRTMFLLRWP